MIISMLQERHRNMRPGYGKEVVVEGIPCGDGYRLNEMDNTMTDARSTE